MRPAGTTKVWRKNGRSADTRELRRRRPTARELRVMRSQLRNLERAA